MYRWMYDTRARLVRIQRFSDVGAPVFSRKNIVRGKRRRFAIDEIVENLDANERYSLSS